jgi:ABC-2 type transport system permease protein
MLHRLVTLITKEIIQFTRDPVLLAFSLLGPALQIMLLGRAIGQDISNMPVAVMDYDLSPLSREIVTALDNTDELVVAHFPTDLDEASGLIDRGAVMGIVIIPPGFMQDTQSATEVGQIQVIIDGVSSLIAARTLGAAQGAVQSLVEDVVVTSSQRPPGGIRIFTDPVFNRSLDFRPDSIASQLGLIVFEITTLVAVMGIVREREIGTLEMLTITPLKRMELIAGKAITPLVIGTLNFLVMLGVTQVVFQVPFRGAFWTLFLLTLLYLGCEICYALMVSTITRSQQQATTVVFVWAMVALTLSGYLVPITTLPKAMQWLSWLVPLRHYLTILRSVMLKGSTAAALLPDALAILFIGALMVVITTRTLSRVIE